MADINRLIGFMSLMQVPFMNDPSALMYIEEVKNVLKSQEPRVLTLEEVQIAEDCCEPVFLEMDKYLSTPDVFSWAMIKHIEPLYEKRIYILDRPGFSSALYTEWYGVYWRCWTARPTDDQRKAATWDATD